MADLWINTTQERDGACPLTMTYPMLQMAAVRAAEAPKAHIGEFVRSDQRSSLVDRLQVVSGRSGQAGGRIAGPIGNLGRSDP
jgi:hypothetical protein